MAIASIKASWSDLKDQRIAQALYGALLHEEYIATGELATAERANLHYLVALELMGQNPRFRAMILGELGILHDDVGNYRIALGYLEGRDKLPFTDNAEGLDVRISQAQALLHVGREADAAAQADEALALIDRNPALAKYRLLALDCAALDNLAAGKFARSLALYSEELPLVDALDTPPAPRDRFVVRLAHAAAALGAEDAARAKAPTSTMLEARLSDGKLAEALRWPHATTADVVRAYLGILVGLRARASRQLGRLDAEARALETRRALLASELEDTGRDELLGARMLTEAQLALNAGDRRDVGSAAAWVQKALASAQDLHTRALGVSDRAQLDVLRLAASLSVTMGAALAPDLPARIDAAAVELATRREPSLRSYAAWLEIYGVLLRAPAAE